MLNGMNVMNSCKRIGQGRFLVFLWLANLLWAGLAPVSALPLDSAGSAGHAEVYHEYGLLFWMGGGGVLLLMGITLVSVWNVFERKKIAKALMQSENRYRSVYETAPLAFVVWDRDRKIQDWNNHAVALFGWSREEVIGKDFFELIIPDAETARVESVVNELMSGQAENPVINQNQTKSGKSIWCEWNNTVLQDAQGRPHLAISLGSDVTDRLEALDELRKHRQNLEELVQERSDKLVMAQQEIEDFVYSVSHDLKAPLRSINGFARLSPSVIRNR